LSRIALLIWGIAACGSAAVVLLDVRVDKLAAMRFEATKRAFLVHTHQPRIARHICGEDRGETALDGLFHGLPCRA
jgi:hypothetical protein